MVGDVLLTDKAYELLKEKIKNYEAGEYISLRSTAKELDIGYTPMREAFQQLEKEGIINRIPNVGYFISKLDQKKVREIFQARECVEEFVMKNSFKFLDKHHIEKLEHLVSKQKEYLEEEKILKFYEMDEKFHMLFFKLYDNTYLNDLIKNIREKYKFNTMKTILENVGLEIAVHEHEEIIESLKECDKEQAVERLVVHIRNAKERALKIQ